MYLLAALSMGSVTQVKVQSFLSLKVRLGTRDTNYPVTAQVLLGLGVMWFRVFSFLYRSDAISMWTGQL